ncbi:MAG: TetR family transcriptional regulator [Oscillospiraceae bacterium]|nr:TetR family transcriptional regulator [Oscillospiraceae bacterium]
MKKRTSKETFGDALLVLARSEDLERITVKQIVEQSGLSLQTFYNHFRDKEDLVAWMHREGSEQALNSLVEKHCSFHEILLACIRFFAENDNYLRGSFGSGVASPYARYSLEGACSFMYSYICRHNGLKTMPEDLRFYVHMFVFSCMCAFNERSFHRWEMTEEQLAVNLERGMPEPLKPYLAD